MDSTNEVKNIDLSMFLGYKFFKMIDDDNYELIRIVSVKDKDHTRCTIMNEETKERSKVDYEYLKEYTPLQPYGIIAFNILKLNAGGEVAKDVMVTGYRMIDLKLKLNNNEPYIICRQSVNDIFYQLISDDPENNEMVGFSVTRETCPTNIEMGELTACSEIEDIQMIHVYKEDNIQSMIQCLDKSLKYNIDVVLKELHDAHCKAVNAAPIAKLGKVIHGWCSDLETLLNTNNFMVDFNQMCEVTGFDVDLTEWMDRENEFIWSLNDACRLFFSTVFKVNAVDTKVIKFDHSINMGDFQNENYVLIRDKNNILWIVVYLCQGEYLEQELIDQINKLDVTTRLQLEYFNKYSK